GAGEGFVSYTIKPKSTLNTGDSISADASIVFDINAPVATNVWWNVIDAVAPTSVILSDPTVNYNTVVNLNVEMKDDNGGSGEKEYLLYYSKDGLPFEKYGDTFTDSEIEFIGEAGSTYCFFTLAKDNVGNIESMKDQCEIS